MSEAENKQGLFSIQRIFVRDVSFESPNVPELFLNDWAPEIKVDFQTRSRKIDENVFEVVLGVTASAKNGDKVAFCVEVHQSGIFALADFPEPQLAYMIGSMCPSILFPYAREAVSELVTKGGFPPLLLAPVNFDALYFEHQAKQAANQSAEKETVDA